LHGSCTAGELHATVVPRWPQEKAPKIRKRRAKICFAFNGSHGQVCVCAFIRALTDQHKQIRTHTHTRTYERIVVLANALKSHFGLLYPFCMFFTLFADFWYRPEWMAHRLKRPQQLEKIVGRIIKHLNDFKRNYVGRST